ncbi:hypothetical protein V6N13_026916 [Hibiscus sabdariffa]
MKAASMVRTTQTITEHQNMLDDANTTSKEYTNHQNEESKTFPLKLVAERSDNAKRSKELKVKVVLAMDNA